MRPIYAEATRGNHTLTLELPKCPSHPCCNSRSSPTYPSPLKRKHESPVQSRGALFPTPSSRRGILSLRRRERIPGGSVASQEEVLSTGKARGTPGWCHHSQSPPDVSVHSTETCFPCIFFAFKPRIERLTPRWNVGQPFGKTSWESLFGKPQRKAGMESHRSLDSWEGKRDTAATAREESARVCPH